MTKEEKKIAKALADRIYLSKPGVRETNKVVQKAWRATQVTTEEGRIKQKAARLKLRCERACTTVEHYNTLPKRCSLKICKATEPGGRGDWHLDHDHVSKQFKGLLCNTCNANRVSSNTYESALAVVEYLKPKS